MKTALILMWYTFGSAVVISYLIDFANTIYEYYHPLEYYQFFDLLN